MIKHTINWNIDVAKILTVVAIITLAILGYNQIQIQEQLKEVENKIDSFSERTCIAWSYNFNQSILIENLSHPYWVNNSINKTGR